MGTGIAGSNGWPGTGRAINECSFPSLYFRRTIHCTMTDSNTNGDQNTDVDTQPQATHTTSGSSDGATYSIKELKNMRIGSLASGYRPKFVFQERPPVTRNRGWQSGDTSGSSVWVRMPEQSGHHTSSQWRRSDSAPSTTNDSGFGADTERKG